MFSPACNILDIFYFFRLKINYILHISGHLLQDLPGITITPFDNKHSTNQLGLIGDPPLKIGHCWSDQKLVNYVEGTKFDCEGYEGVVRLNDGQGKCIPCGKIFITAYTAKRHFMHAHSSTSNSYVKCSKCPAVVKNEHCLKNHLRRIHGIYVSKANDRN